MIMLGDPADWDLQAAAVFGARNLHMTLNCMFESRPGPDQTEQPGHGQAAVRCRSRVSTPRLPPEGMTEPEQAEQA